MKWLLTLALLFAGCSNPCDNDLTNEEQNAATISITAAWEAGAPLWLIRSRFLDNPECGEYLLELAFGE